LTVNKDIPQPTTVAPVPNPQPQLPTNAEETTLEDYLQLPVQPLHRWYLPIKAALDFAIALLIAIPATPIVIVAAAVVKLTSPGPAFYHQQRVGKHGRLFTLLKLRTMIDNAEAMTGPVWASESDPRVTPFGRFLRESHIDEFPQLINVLQGHMSLVGPRPERPEFMTRLQTVVPRYAERLGVRPGITGLTQLRLPPDTDPKGVHKKLVYDLYYVRRANLWLDTRIIAYTGYQLLSCIVVAMLDPLRPTFELPRWEIVSRETGLENESEIAEPMHSGSWTAGDNGHAASVPAQISSAPSTSTVPASDPPLNAFTVDVEDYYQVSAFSEQVDPKTWDDYESRVVENTHRILRMLDDHDIQATFFVLGWVADRHPRLVRDIQMSGHEIGVHSFWHRCVYDMTPDEFREDLLQSVKVVEEITGEPVKAYRAPSFSITADSLWALDVLAECGIQYDSSIFPVYHDTYGIPSAERFPHRIEREAGTLWEFPPSVYPLWKFNLPVSGGGYFRLYPSRMSLQWLQRINNTEQQPFLFYIHPWELDPDQPRLPGSLKSRFRHYQNLRSTAPKLERLLSTFQFGTLSQALEPFDDGEAHAPRNQTVQVDS